jgi:hypothetical protein
MNPLWKGPILDLIPSVPDISTGDVFTAADK